MTQPSEGARLSPRAYARFRALVEDSNLFTIVMRSDIDLTAMDGTFDDLPVLEAYVFGIDARLRNALALAHARYTDMVGCTEGAFASFRDEDRAAYAAMVHDDGFYAADDAIAFMTHACDLPRAQAALWVARAMVQMVRSDMIEDCIETPRWAYGLVQPSDDRAGARGDLDDGLPW